jgi:predicted peptidase
VVRDRNQLGANATWTLAHDEERVAAIVPVSLDTWFVDNKRTSTPVWVFAGEHDEHESYRADRMEKALESVRGIDGTRTKFRCVPGGGHNRKMWNEVYKCSAIYEWLLERAPQ